MATHSSVLAWRIPGTGEPGGLPSLGLHRVGHDWSDLAAAAAAVTKLCPHLCNTVSCSTVGFPVLPYLLEFAQIHIHWVGDAIQQFHPLSCPSPALNLFQHQCVCVCSVTQSRPTVCDPMDYSPQSSSSMEFSRQEYQSGFPFPSPGNLPDPGIKLVSLGSPALAGGFFTTFLPEGPSIRLFFFFFFPMSQLLASSG